MVARTRSPRWRTRQTALNPLSFGQTPHAPSSTAACPHRRQVSSTVPSGLSPRRQRCPSTAHRTFPAALLPVSWVNLFIGALSGSLPCLGCSPRRWPSHRPAVCARRDTPSTRRQRRRAKLDAAVLKKFDTCRRLHVSPRLHADLREAGWKVSEKPVADSMCRQGLVARIVKRRKGRRLLVAASLHPDAEAKRISSTDRGAGCRGA